MLCCRSAYKLRVFGFFSSSLLGIIIERVVVVAPGAVVMVVQKPSIGGVPARGRIGGLLGGFISYFAMG